MNKLVTVLGAAALLATAAFAQPQFAVTTDQGNQTIKMVGAVKVSTVKGAPYTGEEVNETTQVLADGTRIHRESKATVYRDSEGRTRLETPETITITDPVANVTYLLNPKTMTGNKLNMAAGTFTMNRTNTVTSSTGATSFTFTTTASGPDETKVFVHDGTSEVTVSANVDEAKRLAEAKATAIAGSLSGAVAAGNVKVVTRGTMKTGPGEPIGKQMIEGIQAEGMRHVMTIPAGEIGNDRPLQVTNESWYSPELSLTVMTKRSDPRTGDETFRLTNINRSEPAPYLFQLPAGYQLNERK